MMEPSESVRESPHPTPREPASPQVESIPVIVDAVRDFDDVPMARCMFLTIGVDELSEGLTVAHASSVMPIVIIGMLGIVHRPPGANARFLTTGDVEQVFGLIRGRPEYSIELDDLWLPAAHLQSKSPTGEISQGDVYRISTRLFSTAFQFRQERLTMADYLEAVDAEADRIERSDHEAAAFRAWNNLQIEEAREYHYANRSRMLPRKSK